MNGYGAVPEYDELENYMYRDKHTDYAKIIDDRNDEITKLKEDIAVREALLKRVLNEKYSDDNYIDILCDIETLLNLPWYDCIPKHGVLCWATDSEEHPSRIVIINEYFSNSGFPFTDTIWVDWKYATPLTNEEIEAFKQ